MKRLHIISITSACFFLLCAASRAEEAKTAAPKTAAAQPQSKKWEYYKEDWFKYVDGITEAIPPTDAIDAPKVNRTDPALAELKNNLSLSEVEISSMSGIVESFAQAQQLLKERSAIETRMGSLETNDKYTQEYKNKMGAKADERYAKWKKELSAHDQKIESRMRGIKKDVESFVGRLSDGQKAGFLQWKQQKTEETRTKRQAEWNKQKQILEKLNKGK